MFNIITNSKPIQPKGIHSCGRGTLTYDPLQEPPAQRGRFEKLADWLFVRKSGEQYLLIRSFPFNVIRLTEEEIEILKSYLNQKGDLPPALLDILSKHHFLDPEPSADLYLTDHTSAILIVTTACNLDCSGCFASGGDYGLGVKHMPEDVIDATIRYLSDRMTALYHENGFKGKSNLGVHFFGGEPFLVFDRIRYAVAKAEITSKELTKSCGVDIIPDFFVTTNGTFLNSERIRFMKEHKFSLLLSIDGPRHDERRSSASGKGSLAPAIETFRALRAEGIRTRLNTVVLGEDLKDFGETLKWFKDEVYANNPDVELYHTFSFQREGPGSPLGDCGTTYDAAQMKAYIDDLLDFNSLGYQIYETKLLEKRKSGGTFYKCSSGVKRIAVSPDGRVYPCQGFIDPMFDMGSILDGSFHHRDTPISKQLARRNIATLLPCRNCVFSALCPHNVDCAARAHYTLGGIGVIDVNGMCWVGYELMDKILFQGESMR